MKTLVFFYWLVSHDRSPRELVYDRADVFFVLSLIAIMLVVCGALFHNLGRP